MVFFKKNTKPATCQQKNKNFFFSEDGIRSDLARRPLMFPAPGSRWLRAGAGCLLRSSRSSMHVGPAPELNTSSLPDSISPPKTQPDCAWWWPRVCCGPTAIHQDVAEKRKNPVQPSLNSGRKAPATRRLLCLRPAGRGRRPVSRERRPHTGHLRGTLLRGKAGRAATCPLSWNAAGADARSHVQVPLVLSF